VRAAVLASSPASNFSTPATPSNVPATSVPPANAGQGSGALKVILIVVGVIVLLEFLSVASVGFFAWRVAATRTFNKTATRKSWIPHSAASRTTQDPAAAARNIGVDLYPGAEVLRDGSASATFGGVHTRIATLREHGFRG